MPRRNRRKTTRYINEDCMQSAVRDICDGLETPSTAARKYGLKRTTIIYRVDKKQKKELTEVFSVAQEKELMDYLNRYTYLPYDTSGSYKAARQLVYQFVKTHDIKYPKIWDTEQHAGVEWLLGFIQRNPGTNLRSTTKSEVNVKSEKTNDTSRLQHSDEKKCSTKKKIKTESNAQPALECLRKKTNHPVGVLSEQSLESNNSFANSFQSYVESSTLARDSQLPLSDSCGADDMDDGDSPELDLEPECQITMVSIKNEPVDNPTTDDYAENSHSIFSHVVGSGSGNGGGGGGGAESNGIGGSAHKTTNFIPNLDTVPENDDVFNSFGRNIAFQAKELFQHNQIDALELMHEVQTLVNRRLTKMLRLNKANGRKKPAKRLRKLLENDNDDYRY